MDFRRTTALTATAIAIAAALTSCTAPSSVAPSSPAVTTPAPTPVATLGPLPTATLGSAKAAALQKVLAGALQSGYPDALATVITPEGVWSGAVGEDGPNGRRAKPDDVGAIASITKTFTSALIFRLAEKKLIDLDAPLSRYLEGAAAAATNGATVRQALAMRSGIPDTTDESRATAFAVPDRVLSRDDVVASFPKPTSDPGGDAVYSNPTYKLLALAAEHAGGASYATLVQKELADPAAVRGVLVSQTTGTRTPGTWALPTSDGPWGVGGTLPFVADSTFSIGASDMAADTRSLATWVWALFAGDVVSPRSVAAMAVNDGSEIGSGLDPYSGQMPEGTLGHQGSKDGYASIFVALPAEKTVVVVAINDEDAAVDTIAADLLTATSSS